MREGSMNKYIHGAGTGTRVWSGAVNQSRIIRGTYLLTLASRLQTKRAEQACSIDIINAHPVVHFFPHHTQP